MLKKLCTAGVLCVALCAAQHKVSAQPTHGGPSLNRQPPPTVERPKQHPMDRWLAMSVQEREAALAKVPPERRAKLVPQIDNWLKMTPLQRDRARWFFNLPPEQKAIVQDHRLWVDTLPEERRPVIRREINSLQELSPEAREAELQSPSFNRRFDPEERERIRKMVSVMPPE